MIAVPASAVAAASPTRPLWLYLLIAALPFSDFLQTGVVAFNAAPIMGDIGAGPQEYSAVATLYAVVAIGMVFQHRWLVERLGWRRFAWLSCALFATGSLVCAASESLLSFGVGRLLSAAGCASFLTAGRVLVNQLPPSPKRFVGVKFFASGLAWGGVMGPLWAAVAFSHGTWRSAFVALVVPAGLIALLAAAVLPATRPAPASRAHPLGLAMLLCGAMLLVYALQRSNFDFFANPAPWIACAVLALPLLAVMVRASGDRERPPIRFGDLAQTRYVVGLMTFLLCYLVLGANNTVLPMLLRTLNLPLEEIDRSMALGALAGVAAWIVLSRLLPRWPGPVRYYLLALGLLLLSALQLAGLSEAAHPLRHVLPALLCNGGFVIAALSTTAMQTFQAVQHDDTTFSHANQVKNILAQFGVAAGTTSATLCLQWRTALHQSRLVESTTALNPALQSWLDASTAYFTTHHDPATASQLALSSLASMVTQESILLACLDYFVAVADLAAIGLVLLVIGRVVRRARQRVHAGDR